MKQVIIVRKDLGMKVGKTAAQVAHGSLGAVLANMKDSRVKKWLSGQFTKICLKCESEEELLELELQAKQAGMINCLITDAGHTVFDGVPTRTVLAIGPDEEEKINKLTGHLKLL